MTDIRRLAVLKVQISARNTRRRHVLLRSGIVEHVGLVPAAVRGSALALPFRGQHKLFGFLSALVNDICRGAAAMFEVFRFRRCVVEQFTWRAALAVILAELLQIRV